MESNSDAPARSAESIGQLITHHKRCIAADRSYHGPLPKEQRKENSEKLKELKRYLKLAERRERAEQEAAKLSSIERAVEAARTNGGGGEDSCK